MLEQQVNHLGSMDIRAATLAEFHRFLQRETIASGRPSSIRVHFGLEQRSNHRQIVCHYGLVERPSRVLCMTCRPIANTVTDVLGHPLVQYRLLARRA